MLEKTFFLCVAFIGVFLAIPPAPAYAQSPSISINGEAIFIADYQTQPIIINGRALVPLYPVLEELVFLIEWRENAQTVILSRPENTMVVLLGEYSMISRGDSMGIDVAAQMIDGQVMIPIRIIGEASGLSVNWIDDDYLIEITGDVIKRDPVPNIQRVMDGFDVNFSPQDLEAIFMERGIDSTRQYDSGYHDHLGGFSFAYNTGDMWFSFDSSGVLRRVANLSNPNIRTSNGVGIGDSRERVIEVYGNNFRLSPFGHTQIEYFDGETYLSFGFSFRDDTVVSWGIGTVSADEDFLLHFGL